MTPADLADLVRSTAVAVLTDRGLDVAALPESVTVERARDTGHGEYATNVALQSAGSLGVPARDLAGWLAEALASTDAIAAAEIAGPGFVNLRLAAAVRGDLVRAVLAEGERWGRGTALAGTRFELVFAVAHPTTPVPLGAARWVAAGDVLGRLLAAQGAVVTREYRVDDDSADLDRFAGSLIAAAQGEPAPEHGFAGSYLSDIAATVLRREPSALSLPEDERHRLFRRAGVELMLDEIAETLTAFGTTVDEFITTAGADPEPAADGESGSDPEPTADRESGADRKSGAGGGDGTRRVVLVGPDRELPEVGAGVEVLRGAAVRLVADGRPMRVSDRSGAVPTIDDLIGTIGVDAARYALCRRPVDAELDIDLDAWQRRTPDNPLFAVQYAHSRLSAVLRGAADLGIGTGPEDADLALLAHDAEGALIRALAEFPRVLAAAATTRRPHRVALHLESLAGDYHDFAAACPVLPRGDEEVTAVHEARVRLCAAARQVLASGLGLLGVRPAERL